MSIHSTACSRISTGCSMFGANHSRSTSRASVASVCPSTVLVKSVNAARCCAASELSSSHTDAGAPIAGCPIITAALDGSRSSGMMLSEKKASALNECNSGSAESRSVVDTISSKGSSAVVPTAARSVVSMHDLYQAPTKGQPCSATSCSCAAMRTEIASNEPTDDASPGICVEASHPPHTCS